MNPVGVESGTQTWPTLIYCQYIYWHIGLEIILYDDIIFALLISSVNTTWSDGRFDRLSRLVELFNYLTVAREWRVPSRGSDSILEVFPSILLNNNNNIHNIVQVVWFFSVAKYPEYLNIPFVLQYSFARVSYCNSMLVKKFPTFEYLWSSVTRIYS